MSKDFRDFIVTEDPSIVADLWAKFQELDSLKLAEYALSLGLYPPGYEEGQQHSIAAYVPPGHEGQPFLVWEIGLDSPSVDDQEPEEYDDEDNPWEGVVGITDARDNTN